MMKYLKFLPLMLLLLLVVPVELRAEQIRLTLHDTIRMALERNLELKVELYNPAMSEADYQKARGIYDPALKLQLDYNESTNFVFNQPSEKLWGQDLQLDAGLSQLLPTGGTAALGFSNNYINSDTVSAAAGHKSYWKSGLGLSLSQPLLKNFGREATELAIDTALISKDVSLERFSHRVMELVAEVRMAYFRLYSLQEELEVRRASLELSQRILHDTKARVRAGVMPAMETLNAEYGVASREKELIDAERLLQDQAELLARLIQFQLSPEQVLEAVDQPGREQYQIELSAEIRLALVNRADLQEARRNLALLELQTRVADNRTRPDLLLSASATTSGLGQSYNRDLDRMSSGKYPVWGVGLALSYPIGNRAAENEFRKNRLKQEQAALQIKNQEELISNQVRSAVRGVEVSYKQMEVADRGRAFAEERMRAYSRKAEVGMATTKDLLDVENDLAEAKNSQIKSAVAYADAITLLWQATGEILNQERIRLQSFDHEALYKGRQ